MKKKRWRGGRHWARRNCRLRMGCGHSHERVGGVPDQATQYSWWFDLPLTSRNLPFILLLINGDVV